jgi:hypothetical protein
MARFTLYGDWSPNYKSVNEYNSDDFIFLNLEGPILKKDFKKKIFLKSGPTMSSDNFLSSNSKGVAILSNNHLFDYGYNGYEQTIIKLNSLNWYFVGAGKNQLEAFDPLVFKLEDCLIGVLARCENQFGVANYTKAGVAGFDSTLYRQINDLKKKVDLVIVSYHAGAEMSPWPSPNRQDLCRSFIEAGADIIYGHHAHTPQGWEKYKNGLIFYGLGNFCVDPQKWNWHPNALWSLCPEISIVNGKINYEIKTTIISEKKNEIYLRRSSEEELSNHLKYLEICNKPLNERFLLESLWQEVSIKMYNNFYSDWLGFEKYKINIKNIFLNSFLGKYIFSFFLNVDKKTYFKKKYLLNYHLFKCDTHNESISTALGMLGGELKDLRNKNTKDLVSKWMIIKR